MTPLEMIRCLEGAGLALILSDTGNLQLEGNQVVVDRWLPFVREHKTALLDYLQGRDLGTLGTLSPTFFLSGAGKNNPSQGLSRDLGTLGTLSPTFFLSPSQKSSAKTDESICHLGDIVEKPPAVPAKKTPPALPPGYPPFGTSPKDWTPEQRDVVRRCFHGPTGIHLIPGGAKKGGNHA